eukprot:358004_1
MEALQYALLITTFCIPTYYSIKSCKCPPLMMSLPPLDNETNGYCMDIFEAPNMWGEVPLVMFDYFESQSWCAAKGKRLCYDDEWLQACQGPNHYTYPYGNEWIPGYCNDNQPWRLYSQTILNYFPNNMSLDNISSNAEMYIAINNVLSKQNKQQEANELIQHLAFLYQGNIGGQDINCTGYYGVFDLCGNVEEWTTRRYGSTYDFMGNLKGRYWSESRTCQSNLTAHGSFFRFYEIGFRCCQHCL